MLVISVMTLDVCPLLTVILMVQIRPAGRVVFAVQLPVLPMVGVKARFVLEPPMNVYPVGVAVGYLATHFPFTTTSSLCPVDAVAQIWGVAAVAILQCRLLAAIAVPLADPRASALMVRA